MDEMDFYGQNGPMTHRLKPVLRQTRTTCVSHYSLFTIHFSLILLFDFFTLF